MAASAGTDERSNDKMSWAIILIPNSKRSKMIEGILDEIEQTKWHKEGDEQS